MPTSRKGDSGSHSRSRGAEFATRLESLYTTFDHPDAATDPVHIVRRYREPKDREVVGFCAAALAFGRVASVLQSAHDTAFESAGGDFLNRYESQLMSLIARWNREQPGQQVTYPEATV